MQGRVKSRESSKCHPRRAGPAGTPEGREQSAGPGGSDKRGSVVRKQGRGRLGGQGEEKELDAE